MARRTRSSPSAASRSTLLGPQELRWRRLARCGEHRKAALAVRKLLFEERRAALWIRLGHQWHCAGRPEQAIDAYKQGCWLFGEQGDHRKADAVKKLMRQLQEAPATFMAAAAQG